MDAYLPNLGAFRQNLPPFPCLFNVILGREASRESREPLDSRDKPGNDSPNPICEAN
jgi:hypothetical protein